MKNIYKVLGAIAIVAVIGLFAAGCKNEPEEKNETWVGTYQTKAEIEAEVDATWKELGYTTKPTKYIALSFDDGPCPPSNSGGTAAMLAALEKLKVKATFFVIGGNVRTNKTIAQAIFDEGHELANHSDGYSNFGSSTAAAITTSLNACSEAIEDITGEKPRYFRAPELVAPAALLSVCTDMGMPLVHGSAPGDWPGSANAIKTSVLSNPQNGDIILLHDNNTSQGNTMSVLPEIVEGLREKGFWILTVGQLAAVREKTLVAGTVYVRF